MIPRMDHGKSRMRITTELYIGASRGAASGRTQFR